MGDLCAGRRRRVLSLCHHRAAAQRRDPVIPIYPAMNCLPKRDGRDIGVLNAVLRTAMPGHDSLVRSGIAENAVHLTALLICAARSVFSQEKPPSDRKSTRLNSSHGYISYA